MPKKPTTPPTLRVVGEIPQSALFKMEEPLLCLSEGVRNLMCLSTSDLFNDTEKASLSFLYDGLARNVDQLQKAFDKATERTEPLPNKPREECTLSEEQTKMANAALEKFRAMKKKVDPGTLH